MDIGTISKRSVVASLSPFVPKWELTLLSEEETTGLVDDKELFVPLNNEDEEYVPLNGVAQIGSMVGWIPPETEIQTSSSIWPDLTYSNINIDAFKDYDWKDFYSDDA